MSFSRERPLFSEPCKGLLRPGRSSPDAKNRGHVAATPGRRRFVKVSHLNRVDRRGTLTLEPITRPRQHRPRHIPPGRAQPVLDSRRHAGQCLTCHAMSLPVVTNRVPPHHARLATSRLDHPGRNSMCQTTPILTAPASPYQAHPRRVKPHLASSYQIPPRLPCLQRR